MGYSFCRFQCGIPNERMGVADLTDGTWVWPEGLWHYIHAHGVALPDAFLSHVRDQQFKVPPFDLGSLLPDATDEWLDHDLLVSDATWNQWVTERQTRNATA